MFNTLPVVARKRAHIILVQQNGLFQHSTWKAMRAATSVDQQKLKLMLFSVLLEKAANINWKAIFTPDFQSLWLNMQKSTKLQTSDARLSLTLRPQIQVFPFHCKNIHLKITSFCMGSPLFDLNDSLMLNLGLASSAILPLELLLSTLSISFRFRSFVFKNNPLAACCYGDHVCYLFWCCNTHCNGSQTSKKSFRF